jgi:uncharacterized repeat protein (TIGR01451 family)
LQASENFEIVYRAQVQNPLPVSPLELVNISRVLADNDTNLVNNAARDTVVARNATSTGNKNYDLTIQKRADRDSVTAGEDITYTLEIQNLGPDTAFDIAIRDTLPSFLSPVDADSAVGNVLFWQLDSLQASENFEIVYRAQVQNPLPVSPLELVNISRVLADNDTNLVNNAARDTVVARNATSPGNKNYDLTIQKRADRDSVTAGEDITYTLEIQNLGPNTAFDIAIRDTLPDFVTPGNVGAGVVQGNVISWQVDSLRASQELEITYEVTVDAPLPASPIELRNVAGVSAVNDSNAVNDNISVTVTGTNQVIPPCADLGITLVTNKDSVRVGEEFVYTIRINNFGPTTAFNIVVQVSIPDFVTPLDFESREGNELFWRLDSLRAADEEIITFRGRLLSAPTGNQRFANTARVSSDCNDDASNNLATSFLTVASIPEDCSLFRLDLNVFAPERGQPLGINFDLSETRVVQLDLYDLVGYHVSQITETSFPAGQNRFEWNGSSSNGQRIGSGVYVISLRSNNLLCWKKVIIVR